MYRVVPKNKSDLIHLIEERIDGFGHDCDLNHIDVSYITDMSYLFRQIKFNGDISKWNISNVTNMYAMFWNSNFNGDLSIWNVSNVLDMNCMFMDSFFNSDISGWDGMY